LAGVRLIQGATLAGALVAWIAQIAMVASGSAVEALWVHGLAVLLIALAVISWLALPISIGVTISIVALLTELWVLAVMPSHLVACDVLALVALVAMTSLRQRRGRRRLQQLRQLLGDMDEELYLKDQALQITQQNHQALQRKLDRYQQLQTIAENLSRLLNLEAITKLAVNWAFELIGKSEACLLFLVDKERQELALFASKKAGGIPVIRTKRGDAFDHYVLRTHRPLLVNDVHRDFRFGGVETPDRPIASVIACPILVDESAAGVLRLDSPHPRVYTQDDLRFLDILLDLVDTAIANTRLFAQTQELAMTDGLTGVLRRQPLLDHLTREVARANRTRESLSLLMLDLDDFKRYNDTFGHPAGDLVLKAVADVLRSTMPPNGIAGRYGGEEFAVILPKSSREQGAQIAERIRKLVEEASPATGRSMTVSLGLAEFPDDAQAELELIRLADQRLYQAKRSGKNQVCAS
jgi:diguanylate cyclase (GGDEF)-like protein